MLVMSDMQTTRLNWTTSTYITITPHSLKLNSISLSRPLSRSNKFVRAQGEGVASLRCNTFRTSDNLRVYKQPDSQTTGPSLYHIIHHSFNSAQRVQLSKPQDKSKPAHPQLPSVLIDCQGYRPEYFKHVQQHCSRPPGRLWFRLHGRRRSSDVDVNLTLRYCSCPDRHQWRSTSQDPCTTPTLRRWLELHDLLRL